MRKNREITTLLSVLCPRKKHNNSKTICTGLKEGFSREVNPPCRMHDTLTNKKSWI